MAYFKNIVLSFILFLSGIVSLGAQGFNAASVTLSLEQTISLASDSSLEAFRAKNLYMASYWEYIKFKAERLPSLTLNLTPGEYNRTIIRRYDSESNLDVYRQQQAFGAYGGLSVSQNFDLLGGTFFMNSNIDYLRSFGDNTRTQFTSVPVRFGYQQSLLGYNDFKWKKKIEPVKYEKAKKQLAYNLENTSEQATIYFFSLAMAQVEQDLAADNMRNMDTLYKFMGDERSKILAISQTDLNSLKLDFITAQNNFKTAEMSVKRAMFALTSFLNLDKNTSIRLELPNYPKAMDISADKALVEARSNNPELLSYRQSILENMQSVDRTKKESMFNASLYASVGFNQVAGTFADVFRDPMRQDVVSFSVSIPLIDWGVRKGRYNMAKNNLNVTEITSRLGEVKIEEDVIMTVGDFNIQKDLIISAEEAVSLAEDIYEQTLQRFMIGTVDLNTLTLLRQRQQEARRSYIRALENYWISYFKIRKLTLYDFEYNMPISDRIDMLIEN